MNHDARNHFIITAHIWAKFQDKKISMSKREKLLAAMRDALRVNVPLPR